MIGPRVSNEVPHCYMGKGPSLVLVSSWFFPLATSGFIGGVVTGLCAVMKKMGSASFLHCHVLVSAIFLGPWESIKGPARKPNSHQHFSPRLSLLLHLTTLLPHLTPLSL